jgi:hypothetical protein
MRGVKHANKSTARVSAISCAQRTALRGKRLAGFINANVRAQMKIKITVYSLASDNDYGLEASVFTDERKAVEALVNKLRYQ